MGQKCWKASIELGTQRLRAIVYSIASSILVLRPSHTLCVFELALVSITRASVSRVHPHKPRRRIYIYVCVYWSDGRETSGQPKCIGEGKGAPF